MNRFRMLRISLVLALLLMCSSCEMHSLRPWFIPDAKMQADCLAGEWISPGEGGKNIHLVFQRQGAGRCKASLWEDGDDKAFYLVEFGAIGGAGYIQYRTAQPEDPKDPGWKGTSYQLVRIIVECGGLGIFVPDHEKFHEELNVNLGSAAIWIPNRSGFLNIRDLLIVEETKELERFLEKHGSKKELWSEQALVFRQRK